MSGRIKEKHRFARALESPEGQAYWRSAQKLAQAASQRLPRRDLMRLLGASATLAGLGGCDQQPQEQILPYSQRPPELIPGVPVHYATSLDLDGFAIGLLAECRDGRPTKIEGNPEHPASLGATGVYEQASVLSLYDPLRLAAPRFRGAPVTWQAALASLPKGKGARPWLVLHPQSSPLVASLLARFRELYPNARVSFHTPLARSAVYRATRSVFGRVLEPQYHFERAKVVVSIDADFTGGMPNSVRFAHDFSQRRRLARPGDEMARLYVAETSWTATGTLADHRLTVKPSQIVQLSAAILRELSALNGSGELPAGLSPVLPSADQTPWPEWVRAVATDLRRARGESIVIAGDRQPPAVHVLAHAINTLAESWGRTISMTEPALLAPEGGDSLGDLVRAIRAGQVDSVTVLEANPVYTAPVGLELQRWLGKVKHTMCLSQFENETTKTCDWVLPASHHLETWGDARSYDGTLSYLQPTIRRLQTSRSLPEVLAGLSGIENPSGISMLSELYRGRLKGEFHEEWPARLKLGFAPDSRSPELSASFDWNAALPLLERALKTVERAGLELSFEQSPSVYDGRFANNSWLLELPHPTTKQSWGNALLMSPRTARELAVSTSQVVVVKAGGSSIDVPVIVVPGHADGAVSLSLGFGQSSNAIAHAVGTNAYLVRGAGTFMTEVKLTATERFSELARTQEHTEQGGRELAPTATLGHYRKHPDFLKHLRGPQPSLLPVFEDTGEQWAMTIDTTLCSGCSACVVACQAENNVPVVGKQGVMRSREMYWLRIDRYVSGERERPRVVNQPMLCQHCEKAPCEYVCPVNATVHSPSGLNEMIYNRCIGTRFCSNNCPYKVRRFNWFEYNNEEKQRFQLQHNPDVTVRERGVMEKCTYCVQRIRRAEHEARIQNRSLRPGDVVTACQAVCPMRAIQFGSLRHQDTDMVRWRKQPRHYEVLHELGTRPRTQYLAKIFNTATRLEH